MKYGYHKPHNLLTEFVRTVLVMDGSAVTEADSPPIFTNGMSTLLCKIEKDEEGCDSIIQLTLFGKSTTADHWAINDRTTIIAYFFKPFAMASLFNISVKTLSDSPLDLFSWSPHVCNAVRIQLLSAVSIPGKIDVFDNLLVQQLQLNNRECQIVKYATDQIMYNSGKEILSEILTEMDFTERTFQRIFKKYVGVTPTQYRRICQFQLSFGQLRSKKFNKISDVAFDNGFSDQSHFIRSFKEFVQTTPNDYLRNGLKGKNS
jgi:AraC-like DNA-binding protein